MPRIAAAEYLYKENGAYKLKKARWYYQIQGEMALSKVKNADLIIYIQEPITRSQQLPHIPVTAFSQTCLFLA